MQFYGRVQVIELASLALGLSWTIACLSKVFFSLLYIGTAFATGALGDHYTTYTKGKTRHGGESALEPNHKRKYGMSLCHTMSRYFVRVFGPYPSSYLKYGQKMFEV